MQFKHCMYIESSGLFRLNVSFETTNSVHEENPLKPRVPQFILCVILGAATYRCLNVNHRTKVGRGSVVGTATRYGMDPLVIDSRWW